MNQTPPWNPPAPSNARLMRQAEITPAIMAFAVEVDTHPDQWPMYSVAVREIEGQSILARVEWHTLQARTGEHKVLRGVTCYLYLGAENCTVECPTPAQALGVDVSRYQGEVDFAQVASAGYAFAFIKATEGMTITDQLLTDHWKSAGEAGLLRGAYHFFRPKSGAIAQVQRFLEELEKVETQYGRAELPLALDVEVADGVALDELADFVAQAVHEIALGTAHRPLLYTMPGFWNALPPSAVTEVASEADLWVAHWTAGAQPMAANGWDSWRVWQYTNRALVPGIQGAMDVSRFNGDAAALRQLT